MLSEVDSKLRYILYNFEMLDIATGPKGSNSALAARPGGVKNKRAVGHAGGSESARTILWRGGYRRREPDLLERSMG